MAAVAALVVGLCCPAVARANAQGMYGYGSRSTAMAGGVSADVRDFSANYFNPAGLAAAQTLRLDLGYFWAAHTLSSNGIDNNVDPVHGLVGGIVAPGRLFGIPFAFGLGLHLPDERISRSRALPQIQPRWELYDNRVHLIYIAANLAVAPLPWLRIGGGLSFVSSTRGRLDIAGEINYLRTNDSRLTHTVDADLTAVRYPQVGVQIDPLRNLTFSAVYRGSFNISLEIDALVAGRVLVGTLAVPGSYFLSSASNSVTLPQQAVLGVAWRPTEDLTLVADLTWVNWSAYQNPTARIGVGLQLEIPPELTSLRLPVIPQPVDRACSRTSDPRVRGRGCDAGFSDTFVPRVGIEFRRNAGVHQVALRGGYRFDATPVPDQTASATNFMDSSRHVLSAGAGVLLRGMRPVLGTGLTFDIHGELQLLHPRDVHKDDPRDPIGDYRIGGTVFQVGATMGIVF